MCLELLNSLQKQREGTVPGECSCKMKPTNPGREHLDKGTQSYASAPKPSTKPHEKPMNLYR